MSVCVLVVFLVCSSVMDLLQLPTFCCCNNLHDRSATFCISVLQKTCKNYSERRGLDKIAHMRLSKRKALLPQIGRFQPGPTAGNELSRAQSGDPPMGYRTQSYMIKSKDLNHRANFVFRKQLQITFLLKMVVRSRCHFPKRKCSIKVNASILAQAGSFTPAFPASHMCSDQL